MKKIALYILAAAAIFAGCSKNNIETSPVADEDAWMYDATLPVPIRLGANSGSLTKGEPINDLADMDGKLFGFYAVNSGKDPLEGGWASLNLSDMPLSVEDNGVQGHYNAKTGRFDFVGGPFYYNQTDWTPYTFYGYYAHVNDVTNPDHLNGTQEGIIGDDRIFVRLGIGHNDILWGKAEADSVITANKEICYGFNAPYLRNGGAQPVMTFKHMTACVTFNVQQVGNANNLPMQVETVKILNTPVYANLVIASNVPTIKEGAFTATKVDGTIELGGLPQTISTTSTKLGNESLFIYPGPSYKVELSYSYGTSTDSYIAELKPVTKVMDEEGNETEESGFIAGYHYKYNFKVYSPEEIVIEAEIEPYIPAFGTDADGNDIVQDYDPEEYKGSH